MAQLLVLYRKPADAAAFDKYYHQIHVPLVKKIPGLQRYEVSSGTVATPAGPAPYYLTAMLSFASMEALRSALASPEGRASAADLANFAQAGAELLMFDTKTLWGEGTRAA